MHQAGNCPCLTGKAIHITMLSEKRMEYRATPIVSDTGKCQPIH
jgi:hypothetical protein